MADNLSQSLGTDIAFLADMYPAPNGDLAVMSGLDNLKQALWRRLITTPGSLVHRPDYGVGIKDFQNAPGTLSMMQKLASRIQEQFTKDPRVNEVTGVACRTDDNNPAIIYLTVTVDVVGYGELPLQYTPFSEGT